MKRLAILGGGESGVGAAILGKQKGYEVFVSDKGEISKSGTPILPSKRARKIPEKIQVSSDDLEELTAKAEPEVDVDAELEVGAEETAVSLDQIAEAETTKEDTEETEPNS